MIKPKILLVENSSIVLQIEKRYLKNESVSIASAADGDEALTVARDLRPDLVYISFSLPGMDGAACCSAMKADPGLAGVPVVMVTNPVTEEIEQSRAAGCDAVISKPLDRREFLDAARSFLVGIKRRNERTPCRAIAACILNNETFNGTIEDISVSGMYIGTSRDIAPGDILDIKFVLPWSGAALVEARGEVAWLNSGYQRRKYRLPVGFGLLFYELSDDAKDQVKDYLEFSRMKLGK